MSEKVYPEWVQKQKTKGTSVRKVGNNYYLYKHSSKRIPGKKNPVPNDTYIGKITPDGIVKSSNKKIASTDSDVVVKEYGYSRALQYLCPTGWKNPLGESWQTVLDYIIVKDSPESYIKDIRVVVEELDPHIQYAAQKGTLIKRIRQEYGINIKDLLPLSTVYVVSISGKRFLSRLSEEHRKILEKINLELEVY